MQVATQKQMLMKVSSYAIDIKGGMKIRSSLECTHGQRRVERDWTMSSNYFNYSTLNDEHDSHREDLCIQ